MSIKTKSILALFVALAIILAVKPRIINNIYNTVLGRLFLIIVVIFFAMHNVTLGLLVVLAIILVTNQFSNFTEGMETMATPGTIGEENVPITGKQKVLTRDAEKKSSTSSNSPTISELKANAVNGVDKEDIKNAISSKDSKTIPTDPNTMKSSENVNAHTSKSLLTESFCPCAASVGLQI